MTSVGYTPDYFRMKNSWGRSWGESGYFRIARGNVCGITNMGFAPTFQSTGKTDDGTDEEGKREMNSRFRNTKISFNKEAIRCIICSRFCFYSRTFSTILCFCFRTIYFSLDNL